jgi:hypothetical protein
MTGYIQMIDADQTRGLTISLVGDVQAFVPLLIYGYSYEAAYKQSSICCVSAPWPSDTEDDATVMGCEL